MEDFHEDVAQTDITACYSATPGPNGTTNYTPVTSQATIAQQLIGKKKQKYRIGLHTVLSATR